MRSIGTFLVVQWLRLHVSSEAALSSKPGQGTDPKCHSYELACYSDAQDPMCHN